MNLEGISNHMNHTLNSQKRYIIFNVIVKVSSIVEFIRHEYETTLNEKGHFDKMALKYSDLAKSTELLNNFRNTIHYNGFWGNNKPLKYELREGTQEFKKGVALKYDHLKLYRIIEESIELHNNLATNNEEIRLRNIRTTINGKQLVVLKQELDFDDWNNLFEKR